MSNSLSHILGRYIYFFDVNATFLKKKKKTNFFEALYLFFDLIDVSNYVM